MITKFADILTRLGAEPTAREIAETLFLALRMMPVTEESSSERPGIDPDSRHVDRGADSAASPIDPSGRNPQSPTERLPQSQPGQLYRQHQRSGSPGGGICAMGVRAASAIAL